MTLTMTLTMTEPKIIELQEAADFLTDPKRRYWLFPFFAQEVTQKDVAECFDITLGAVDYRVKKLLTMGLIEITREEVINGHRTRFYRITSQEFIVPLEATSSTNLESYGVGIAESRGSLVGKGWAYGMQQQSDDWGFRIGCADKIGVYQAIVGKNPQGEYSSPRELPNYGKYLVCDAGLCLSDADAEKLHKELRDLYDTYRKKSHESKNKQNFYLLELGFVPINT